MSKPPQLMKSMNCNSATGRMPHMAAPAAAPMIAASAMVACTFGGTARIKPSRSAAPTKSLQSGVTTQSGGTRLAVSGLWLATRASATPVNPAIVRI